MNKSNDPIIGKIKSNISRIFDQVIVKVLVILLTGGVPFTIVILFWKRITNFLAFKIELEIWVFLILICMSSISILIVSQRIFLLARNQAKRTKINTETVNAGKILINRLLDIINNNCPDLVPYGARNEFISQTIKDAHNFGNLLDSENIKPSDKDIIKEIIIYMDTHSLINTEADTIREWISQIERVCFQK